MCARKCAERLPWIPAPRPPTICCVRRGSPPATPIRRKRASGSTALEDVVRVAGHDRALALLRLLEEQAQQRGIVANVPPYSAYRNTIPVEQQAPYPGDLAIEERDHVDHPLERAGDGRARQCRRMASSAATSAATRRPRRSSRSASITSFARTRARGGDLVFFQPHSAPGVYARAFLEGRLTEAQLANYRQEVGGGGLSSYPHPWLMPEFWQFPTGSMGLGPISAIYQARFMRYLQHRGIADTSASPRVGRFRRRRDGRARIHRRAHARRAREARQPHLRHQLQPAAARRPGARQRPDHPGARSRCSAARAGT